MGLDVCQWGGRCSVGGCLGRRTAAGTPFPVGLSGQREAVSLHLQPCRELPGGQAGVGREHSLTHLQMFIKYVFWGEHYARPLGYKKREM